LVSRDDFLRQLVGNVVVVGGLHRIARPALRFGSEIGGITEHFGERHLGLDDDVVATRFAAGNAAAPRAEVAHQVTGLLIRRVNFHVHDGLKQRRTRLLHSFLERQRAGNLERNVRRIHVVVFAVVQNGAKIRYWKPCEIAARGRVANTLFDRRNPVFRNRSAENIVDELDALAALDRLELHAADAELAVPAGLFLVLAFGVGLTADGFAVGHFGRLQREVHVVALLELGDDHLDVLLAGTGEQKLFGLRIARIAECGVLFQYFVNPYANLVFIGARLRLNRKGDGWLRQTRGGIENRRSFIPQRIAGGGFFQFRNRANLSRMQLAGLCELFSLHHLDVLKALG